MKKASSRDKELARAFANLKQAIADTPETHPEYEKLTGKKRSTTFEDGEEGSQP